MKHCQKMKYSWLAVCTLALWFLCGVMPGRAATEAETPYVLTIPQLSAAPVLTATLGGSWDSAATLHLMHEATYRKTATEDTTVRIGAYGGFLYIAFQSVQREPLVASQVSDGTGVLTGDAVMVHLWPNGLQGFAYWFATNVHGARDQFSSENSAYAPAWTAFARRTADGYVAILKIPLSAMHVQKGASWRAQFHRIVVASNSNYVWELDPNQTSFIDGRYGGHIDGLTSTQAAAARPRMQIYGLSAIGSARAGGTTSRMGVDISVPVTPTASIFGTAHPDFSNVEVDQQSISPTVFARRFAEVRPFFTQAAGNFNQQVDVNAPMAILYTPAIPAFRDGYGAEGREGNLAFGAVDAAGYGRNDNAQSFTLTDSSQRASLTYQRVGVHAGDFHDSVQSASLSYLNPRSHLTYFVNGAVDTGSRVSDASSAKYQSAGVSFATNISQVAFSLQKMGPQFNPADGYANQPPGEPGIAGYTVYAGHALNFSPTARVQDVNVSASYDRYHGPDGSTNQTDFATQARIDFRGQLSLSGMQMLSSLSTCVPVSTASCARQFLPYNGTYWTLGYALNTAHPSSLTFASGAYYHGRLDLWQRALSIPLTPHTAVSLEADDTRYTSHLPNESDSRQWLERAGVNMQFSSMISMDAGVRRIVGTSQPFPFAPFGPPGSFTPAVYDATNISAALHYFHGSNELYVVYGDPNELFTRPTLFLKLIRYVGAGKGT